jgi:tetratricopeptide (TPR) repeat protein
MRWILFIFLIVFSPGVVHSQNDLLAQNYFEQGEYEKALTIYNKLLEENPNRYDYFISVVASNQQLENFEASEKLLIDKINSGRVIPHLYIELGYNFSLQKNDSIAQKYYNEALEFINANPNYAPMVGETFEKYSLLDMAVSTYENAMDLSGKDYNTQLARLYGEQGDLDKMFKKYLDLIVNKPIYKSRAQRSFSLYVTEDPNNSANIALRKALLKKIQEEPNLVYNELLSWVFIQQMDYKKAFTQEKAIYKRMEDGDLNSMFDLALIAIANEYYEDATEIVNFIIENSSTPETRLEGHQYSMKIALNTAKKEDYQSIVDRYDDLLTEYGTGKETYLLQIDYNHFLTFSLERKDEAITNLRRLLDEALNRHQKARVKMKLADILVYDEKFNEALIYYSQIQKDLKSDVLAQEARFKVARTSYYKGDFSWAKIQLDVLKKSASQLIANDAMQLSLIIQDNSFEDSTQTALKKYARADLLVLQRKNDDAIGLLKDILTQHKGEMIEDEALLKLGEIYENQSNYALAESSYLKLIEFYNEDILADDAHYRLARLYEKHLDQIEKAKEYYELIIFNFADSIFYVDAQKKYRVLRGDAIE